MRELAIQSGTGTSATGDRAYLDQEYQALLAEIRRIANNTQWNGRNVLDGTAAGYANAVVALNVSADMDGFSKRTITGEAVIDMIVGVRQLVLSGVVYGHRHTHWCGRRCLANWWSTTTSLARPPLIARPPTWVARHHWRRLTTTTGEKVVHDDIIDTQHGCRR